MRQRASIKTQRRLKQQQLRDPYALTDDVYTETPTFHVGGLVTAVGVLQVVVAMALGGFVFGGALLFCAVLLAVLGLALLHHSDPKGNKQGLGLKQAIQSLLALRRSALDYSLTLSIAHSQQQTQKELEIAVVPSSPTPQKVVATMALEHEVRKTKRTMGGDPLVTLNPVEMKSLPTIHSCSVTEELLMEKPRANSEPKQVLRSRPLLTLKPKTQQLGPVQEKKQLQKTAPVLPTVKKSQQIQAKTQLKPQCEEQRKKPELKASKVATKKEVQLPAILPKAEPKVVIPAVLQKVEPAIELPKPNPVEMAHHAKTIVVEPAAPVVAPLSIFPERKTLVDIARGEAPMERELTFTRKVTLYLNPEDESVDLEEELEQDVEEEERELEQEQEKFTFSLEAFPPLSPPMIPQASKSLSATDVMEPNFLMHIELEPISKPEKKLISLNSLRLKPIGDADLRSMLIELDSMQQDLDAAMARCNSLLNGEEETSASSSPDVEPEEEPIFCC